MAQEPQSLIKYQPSVQIYDQMKQYHLNQQQNNNHNINHHQRQHQEIIHALFPPRQWTDHFNKLHIQYVSNQPASRQDVIDLKEKLQHMLEDRQAKNSGICGIRQQLFSQTFDQIIRQVAIDCPQRGLLLMRVRDQHKMTLAAYQTIYQSSVCFGMRKQLQSQQGKDNLQEQILEYQKKVQQLQNKKDQLLADKQLLEKHNRDNVLIEKERRQQQLKFLVLQTENLTKFLDSVKNDLKSN